MRIRCSHNNVNLNGTKHLQFLCTGTAHRNVETACQARARIQQYSQLQCEAHETSLRQQAEAGGRLSANLTPKQKSLIPKKYANIQQSQSCSHRCNDPNMFTKIQLCQVVHKDTIILKRFTEIPQSQNSHAMLQSGAQETVASTTKLRPAEGSAPPTLRNKHTMISKYSQTELQQLQMFQKT